MNYDDAYKFTLYVAKRLNTPRSFLNIVQILQSVKVTPQSFFLAVKDNYDDLISSFIISRTEITAKMGVVNYLEREPVAIILAMFKDKKIDPSIINPVFAQKNVSFRLPNTLDQNTTILIENAIIANNCIEICRIGNKAERIYEISFFGKKYCNSGLEEVIAKYEDLNQAFKYLMDNILDLDEIKPIIIKKLGQYGYLLVPEDGIDKIVNVLDCELAGLEVVKKVKEKGLQIDQNSIYDYTTLWLLNKDMERRAAIAQKD